MSQAPRPRAVLVVTALAFFTDSLLYYLLVPLLPAYARELHASQMELGVLFASYSVALVAGTFPFGALADRVGRRQPLLWGLVGLAASTLFFAIARSYPLLVLARLLQGLSAAATWTAGLALLADAFPAERRGRAMATAFACANVGVLLGPPVAGILSERYGQRAPFLLAAALALADAAARVLLLRDVAFVPRPRVGLRTLLADRHVRVWTGATVLGASLFALLESTLPLDLDARVGMSATAIGLAFAAAAAAHSVTSPLMGALSDRIGRERVLLGGLAAVTLLLPLPALAPGPLAVGASLLALGSAASFVLAPCSPALADAVERSGTRSFGSVFSLVNLAFAAGTMVAPLVGSALVSGVGLPAALAVCGLAFAAYVIPVRRLPRQVETDGGGGGVT